VSLVTLCLPLSSLSSLLFLASSFSVAPIIPYLISAVDKNPPSLLSPRRRRRRGIDCQHGWQEQQSADVWQLESRRV
jgi:hypothetical protein